MCQGYRHDTVERLAQIERQIRTIAGDLRGGQPRVEVLQQVNNVHRQLDELVQGLHECQAGDVDAEQFASEWASFRAALNSLTEP